MLRAVKLWKSSSICGPSATAKPRSPQIWTTSSQTWLTGWMVPWRCGPDGSVTSTLSDARRVSSAASCNCDLRAAIASANLVLQQVQSGAPLPCAHRATSRPSDFMRSEIEPFLPSAETRSGLERGLVGRTGHALQNFRVQVTLKADRLFSYAQRPGLKANALRLKGPAKTVIRAETCLESGFRLLDESGESLGSRTARSARILRSTSIPALSEPVDKSAIGQPQLRGSRH